MAYRIVWTTSEGKLILGDETFNSEKEAKTYSNIILTDEEGAKKEALICEEALKGDRNDS